MTRAELLALAARCEQRENNTLRPSHLIPLLAALTLEEQRGGPLPDNYADCAAALRARAEEAPNA